MTERQHNGGRSREPSASIALSGAVAAGEPRRPEFGIKAVPEDFVVEECLYPSNPHRDGAFGFLRLVKCGHTTFEALELISESLDIPTSAIGYAGLKDEDGVTSQTVSLPWATLEGLRAPLSWTDDEKWAHAVLIGRFAYPIAVGSLAGNAFRVVIRGLNPEVAAQMASFQSARFPFLNYYDTQRFGLPNAPKHTHLAGQALSRGDAAEALWHLQRGRVPDACEYAGDAAEFFSSRDQRQVAFYLSAHESFRWNQELVALAAEHGGGASLYRVSRDGLEYVFAPPDACRALARDTGELDQHRYRYVKETGVTRLSNRRATVLDAKLDLSRPRQDATSDGKMECTCRFFLPSGTYATMLLAQLVSASQHSVIAG